jgi:hypothetical protein
MITYKKTEIDGYKFIEGAFISTPTKDNSIYDKLEENIIYATNNQIDRIELENKFTDRRLRLSIKRTFLFLILIFLILEVVYSFIQIKSENALERLMCQKVKFHFIFIYI